MIRKPTVVGYWLGTARAAIVVFVLMLILLPVLVPRAIDAVLPLVYQPVIEEKLFGLIKRERELKAGLGKGRALILSESLTFTNYLERIGFAWNMLVSTSRKKRAEGD